MSKDDTVVFRVLMEVFFHQFMTVANFMYPLYVGKNDKKDECDFRMYLLQYLKERVGDFDEKGV